MFNLENFPIYDFKKHELKHDNHDLELAINDLELDNHNLSWKTSFTNIFDYLCLMDRYWVIMEHLLLFTHVLLNLRYRTLIEECRLCNPIVFQHVRRCDLFYLLLGNSKPALHNSLCCELTGLVSGVDFSAILDKNKLVFDFIWYHYANHWFLGALDDVSFFICF